MVVASSIEIPLAPIGENHVTYAFTPFKNYSAFSATSTGTLP